jgi:hypothetical protein
MQIEKAIPKAPELIRETLVVIGGAIIAAAIVGSLPALRDWIKTQWGYAPEENKPW